MKIYSEIYAFVFIICVFGADEDGVKRESVMEGDSVTLDTHLREEFNHIQWRFGGSIIAESDGNTISYTDDERFRDRLKMNNQTGSLTINNMRITDSGLYEVRIEHNSRISYKKFSVTVHVFGDDEDGVKRVSVMEGDSVTLDTRLREKFNHIMWRFGGSIIAEIDSNEISNPLNYTERFRDRLKLNDQTGSLTINNTRITDSGLYELEIHHSAGTATVTFMVIVCGSFYPDPGLSPGDVIGIVVVLLLMLPAAAAVPAILYCRHKISKRKRQNHEEKTESAKEGESVALKTYTEKQTDEETLRVDPVTRSLKKPWAL